VTGFAIIDAWLSDSVWRHEMIVSALRHMVLPVLTLAVPHNRSDPPDAYQHHRGV
jgi:ABC-type antimicrobial peptide transport system permease subunit